MKFSYTIAGGAVRIDRVEEPQQIVIIPDNLDGYPVTELGDYALAGSSLEEIWLPTNLKKIGAYGFYNCERLRCLHCSSRTIDLGTGLFAGAGSVEVLDMELFEGEKSCLKELLSELRQTLRVRLRLGENGGEARLIFPEYYEESVENTPARILYIETHGCGHRYRYCFGGTEFEYQKYDELFPHVKVQEPEDLVTELALGRLGYPLRLSGKYEKMYQEYVTEHWKTAGRLLIGADVKGGRGYGNVEAGRIPWLVETVLRLEDGRPEDGRRKDGWPEDTRQEDRETNDRIDRGIRARPEIQVQELIQMAQQAGDTQAVSWLMDFRHRNTRREKGDEWNGQGQRKERKRRRFEL